MFENNMNMFATVKSQTTNEFHVQFVFYTEIQFHSNCSKWAHAIQLFNN